MNNLKIISRSINMAAIIKSQYLYIWLLLLLLSGCGSLMTANNFSELEVKTEARAISCENKGELRQALYQWRILQGLRPDDLQVRNKVESLSKRLRILADKHYNNGLRFQRQGNLSAAREEFIKTLAVAPEHNQAFISLQRITRPASINYQSVIKKAPTSEVAAKPVCPTASKAGSVIKVLNSPGLLKLWLTKASFHADRQHYKKCLALVDKIERIYPKNPAALRLKNAAIYLQSQKQLSQKNSLPETTKKLPGQVSVKPAAKGSGHKSIDKRQAELHYRQGLKYFLQENLAQAISEWETTLKYNPDHNLAVRDLANARMLLENLNNID